MDAITVAIQAAQKAGEMILGRFDQPQVVSYKGPADIVTQVDKDAEQLIVDSIHSAFPRHEFLAEEGHQASLDAENLWVIDPLDGTRNFANGIPFFCTSIALAHRGQTVLGVIYDPIRKEMFHSMLGKGAYLNDRPIRVSPRAQLEQGILSLSLLPVRRRHNPRRSFPMLAQLYPLIENVRSLGSAALHLAYVACGRFDICYQDHVNAWDILAGALMIREAGGTTTDYQGQPISLQSDEILAANGPAFHREVLRIACEVMAKADVPH